MPSANGKALLVASGTELSIAPKTRSKTNGTNGVSATGPSAKEIVASATEAEHKAQEAAEIRRKRVRVLRTLPPRIMPPYNPSCSSLEDGSIAAVGFVSRRLLNTLSELPHDAAPKAWVASVKRVAGPQNPTQESSVASAAQPPVPRILLPTDSITSKTTDATAVDSESINKILVSWASELEIPDGHMVIYGSVADLQDWDLTR